MADHEITKKISESYNDLVLSCDFVCNVNEPDLTEEERVIVKKLHPETMKRYHGSGLAIPSHVQGCKILDVGSGSGSLVFILSKLVGPKGHVTGVDIASNMTDISRKYRKYHCDLWGLSQPNIEFHCGNAERLKEDFGFKDNSFDIIVSNGVLCLCPNKEKVLASIHSTLKEGGEFYLNDVYMPANKPQKNNGLTGSKVWPEFGESMKSAGFTTSYMTMAGPVDLSDEYTAKVQGAKYVSAGHRMFKLPKGAHRGPAKVTYKGNIAGHKDEFKWDVDLTFKTGTPMAVDAELATILAFTRYKDCFDFDDVTAATTKRAQNAFIYLEELAATGKPFPYIYEVK